MNFDVMKKTNEESFMTLKLKMIRETYNPHKSRVNFQWTKRIRKHLEKLKKSFNIHTRRQDSSRNSDHSGMFECSKFKIKLTKTLELFLNQSIMIWRRIATFTLLWDDAEKQKVLKDNSSLIDEQIAETLWKHTRYHKIKTLDIMKRRRNWKHKFVNRDMKEELLKKVPLEKLCLVDGWN